MFFVVLRSDVGLGLVTVQLAKLLHHLEEVYVAGRRGIHICRRARAGGSVEQPMHSAFRDGVLRLLVDARACREGRGPEEPFVDHLG